MGNPRLIEKSNLKYIETNASNGKRFVDFIVGSIVAIVLFLVIINIPNVLSR